ncbi:protein of unknown function DUF224 cysteine-rich region domain protein [Thermodesulfatator indicus DSM 15286]|uniref:Cysteine-rich domain-containing protein n=1 Tax=Thermodesulfatator indicus (strain DSM 15286 / JCM 11887 / CIR29812) TaxID=667014 RepID=F8ACI1_THEID|nr:heterodisulfide reductase-related iron-sulfur binding cluster [Thermodesulfatator indicus]AEH44683.1 protein of unknown function DUF224 cysteine-rich region domain protein [Thermodesulfatator indicus DSM 15286]
MSSITKFAYYPGCSLEGLATEAEEALLEVAKYWDIELIEIPDWNCCGSSSAHNLCEDLARKLTWRILASLPNNTSEILTLCPSCFDRLRLGLFEAQKNPKKFLTLFGQKPNPSWKIRHFVEVLASFPWHKIKGKPLSGLRLAPYYGCLLYVPAKLPPPMEDGLMEKMLSSLGAEIVPWPYAKQCCGTYLSIIKPDFVSGIVRRMMMEAQKIQVDALVTHCVMCQMNLEMRAPVKVDLPVFHLSELLALGLGQAHISWFKKHLLDPLPLLLKKGFC